MSKLTPVPGATLRQDDDGNDIVVVATCGHCGRSWNDAAISSVTPVPAGRCPFEYEHADEDEPTIKVGDVVYMEGASALLGDVVRVDEDGAEVRWRTCFSTEQPEDLIVEPNPESDRVLVEIQAQVDKNMTERERLWLMYSPEHEETWETLTAEQVHEAYEALPQEEHERIYETQFSSESYEEKECIDALVAGLEIAMQIVKGEAA